MPFSAAALWTLIIAGSIIAAVFLAQRFARNWLSGQQFQFNVWLTTTWMFALFAIAELIVGMLWSSHWANGILWGLGLAWCGFLFGFIFAIPKADRPANPAAAPVAASAASGLRANTNLEEISDWLTKILVGVSLIQVRNLPDYIGNLAGYMIAGSDGVPVSAGISMIVTFCPSGFLAGWIITRTFFSGIIAAADTSLHSAADTVLRAQALPSSPEKKLEMTPEARRAAETVANLTPADAENSHLSLDALTVAQLGVGQPASALATIEAALKKDPNNVRLHYLRAMTLRALGRRDEAVAALDDARQKLSPSTEKSIREAVYNSLTYSLLYQPPPDGFTRAIALCEEYLRQDPAGIGGAILVNLACAHGQAARYNIADKQVFAEHRQGALDAAKKALDIDSKWLPRLAGLLHPSEQQKKEGEDDLEVFAGDPEFESLLTGRA